MRTSAFEMTEFNKEDQYFSEAVESLRNWQPQNNLASMARADSSEAIQVIDMFSGCGGMSLGFASLAHSTGQFKLIGAVDVNEKSLQTYAHNYGAPALRMDIREISKSSEAFSNFLTGLDGYNPNKKTVLIGCAPCQGFSAHRKKNWDNPDERNGLVEAFTDIACKMEPECIIMENVPELLSKKYWHHFEYFRDRLIAKGYKVKQSIHNAAGQGVPQERFRAIVVAMKQNFYLPEDRFSPANYKTVRNAIGDLPKVKAGEVGHNDKMHRSARHKASTIDVIKAVPKDGGSRPNGIGPKCLQDFKGFADVYGRLSWDKPSITITHYARNPASGRFVHPEQHRGLSMREAARLQSFPDGFEFKGGNDDVYRQIGEAVPPLLSAAIAATTLANLRNEAHERSDALTVQPVNNSFAGVIAGIKSKRK